MCTPILHPPPAAVAAVSHALGVVVRDVVLTADEIRGLTAGLLVSHQPALGRTRSPGLRRRSRRRATIHLRVLR
jgi:hypothetical protein